MAKSSEETELPKSVRWRLCLVALGMVQITLGAGLLVGALGRDRRFDARRSDRSGRRRFAAGHDDATVWTGRRGQLRGAAAAGRTARPGRAPGVQRRLERPRRAGVPGLCFRCWQRRGSGSAARGPVRMALGLCLVTFGGPGVQTSLIHLGNLFPDRRYLVMGIVSETITLSFAILPLMDLIWERTGVSFRWIFGVYGVIMAASTVLSVLVWPDAPYAAPSPEVLPTGKRQRSPVQPPLPDSVPVKQPPLESHLRQEGAANKWEPGESFLLESPKALQAGDGVALIISLKDMPLHRQLSSGVYLRVSIFFFVTSFWANFYIATVTTELGDLQEYDADTQHRLARQLSFIDAAAIVCAPLSGYLLNSVGFIPTAAITVALGIGQMVLVMVANGSEALMVISFVFYAVFRAFLFPYFFASLSRKLGFKYFGMLTGLGFCASGISQLAIAPLATAIEGTCHEYINSLDVPSCSHGKWTLIHAVQILFLAALFLVLLVDVYSERKFAQQDVVFTVNKSEMDETQPLTDTAPPSEYGSAHGSVDEAPVEAAPEVVKMAVASKSQRLQLPPKR